MKTFVKTFCSVPWHFYMYNQIIFFLNTQNIEKWFWTKTLLVWCVSHKPAAAVSHVVACKDLDAGEEEAVAAATSAALASSTAMAAVKALVLLLQSIDLGRVHFSCAFFLYYEQSRSIVATANVACLLPDVIYQSRDPQHNGLVHLSQRHSSKVTWAVILYEQYTKSPKCSCTILIHFWAFFLMFPCATYILYILWSSVKRCILAFWAELKKCMETFSTKVWNFCDKWHIFKLCFQMSKLGINFDPWQCWKENLFLAGKCLKNAKKVILH